MTGGSGNNRGNLGGNSGKSTDPLTVQLDGAFESLQSEFGQLLIERSLIPTAQGAQFSYRIHGRVEMICRIGTDSEGDPFAANRIGVQELVSDGLPTVGEAVADFNEKAERMGKLVKLFRAAEKKVHGIMEDLGEKAREAEHSSVEDNLNTVSQGGLPFNTLLDRGFLP